MARSKNKPIHTTKDVVQIAYRYRAYPTDLQVWSMENWMGSLCHLSNEAIEERKEAYKATGKGLTYREQQNALPKKRKGSVNYQAQKIVLARTHEHVGNQRADFLHKLSLSLVIAYAYIAFEQLNIPGMVRNPHLAKSILDAGWGTLIRFVAYKSVMLRGNEIERVNAAYSSQDCSGCGYRVPKTLVDRVHICPWCGLVLCRDTNSA